MISAFGPKFYDRTLALKSVVETLLSSASTRSLRSVFFTGIWGVPPFIGCLGRRL